MKRLSWFAIIVALALIVGFGVLVRMAHCQIVLTTNVVATVTDPDSQTWFNATWSAQLYNPVAEQKPVYTQTGQPVPVTIPLQSLDGTGYLGPYAFPDNNKITPAGTRWNITLCSNTSAACATVSQILITGTLNQDISQQINSNLPAPRYTALHSAHGYNDLEPLNPVTGTTYYNVTSQRTRIYNGTAWLDLAGPGSSSPGNPAGSLQMNSAGVFTGVTNSTVDTNGNITAPSMAATLNRVVSPLAPPYNAKCDGVTDDQTALQLAFNTVLSTNAQIQFPAGTCLTSTIVWKGQSFFGAGKGITIIKGKPGQDVFQVPDNHSFNFPQGTTVHDLNVLVDTSINKAATAGGGDNTFPNRIAGLQSGGAAWAVPIVPGNALIGGGGCAQGATILAGSLSSVSITCTSTGIGSLSYAIGLLDPALVLGAPITINGAGAAGGTYTGTISAITNGCTGAATCTITISPAALTPVTNAKGNMLAAQTPPWYIGNAGFAFQCSNGSSCSGNVAALNMYNVQIDETGNTSLHAGHSAAIFTQQPMYSSHFEKVQIDAFYGGYVEAAPPTGPVGTGDTSSFKDMDFFHSVIPFVLYNGSDRAFSNINLYAEYPLEAGLYQLAGSSSGGGWTFNGIYSEGNWSQSGEIGRLMGNPIIHGANIFNGYPGNAWIEWLATGGKVDGQFGFGIKVDGNMNEFINTTLTTAGIADNGYGNNFENKFYGSAAFWGRRYNASPIPPRSGLGTMDASFLLSGNASTPYLNENDFFTTCADWSFSYNPTATGTPGTCVPDPNGTEITRRYYQSPASAPTQNFDLRLGSTAYQNAWVGQSRTVGVSNQIANGGWSIAIPKTKILVSVNAQCVGAPTCTARGYIKDIQANTNILPLQNISFTNSWTTQSWIADFSTGTTGDVVAPLIDSWAGTGLTAYQIAWIAMIPLRTDLFSGSYWLPSIVYSAAGTALPTCAASLKGTMAIVSDATTPTYNATYASGGAITVPVLCNGTNWTTH